MRPNNEYTARDLRSLTSGDALLALALGLFSLALFARTACPSLYVGDCPEIAGAAATYGVPHPPGYPLFTLLTGSLIRLAPALDPAYLANLAVGLYGALAVSLLTLLVRRLGLTRGAAIFAALSLTTGRTFWSQCVAAEVYSFDVLLFFACLHGLLFVARNPERHRVWIGAGLLLGLWVGHRALNVVFVPPLLGLLVATLGLPACKKHLRQFAWAAVATVLAATIPILYLVLASRMQPAIDVGDPESLPRLWAVLRGAPYARHMDDASLGQAVYRLSGFVSGSLRATELGVGFFAALLAIASAFRRRTAMRGWVLSLVSLVVIDLLFASRYAVLDIEVFFLPAWSACALLSAIGWDQLVELARLATRPVVCLVAALMLGLVGLPLNFACNDLSEHQITRVFADALLESLPPDSIFFVNGDTSIHAMWYLQGVEEKRTDVTVVSLGHLVPWHLEQLEARAPGVHWPERDPQVSASAHARAIMLANIDSRPVCFSTAIDTTPIIIPQGQRGFELFTRGLVRQVFYTGQSLDLRQLVDWNLEFFERTLIELGELPHELDMDSRSTLLQFSVCLYLTAQRARQRGWNDLERRALEASLFCEPDHQELTIHEDVKRGLGIKTPLNQFGSKARERLSRLRPIDPSDKTEQTGD